MVAWGHQASCCSQSTLPTGGDANCAIDGT
jgi:hypothetical protein